MANDINSVTLIGRLTRDAELKYSNSGTAFVNLSLANNYSRKQGEEWMSEVNYFDVTIIGKRAEALHKYLVKGKQIGIHGELRQDRWEQDGQKRYRVKIMADDIQLLGGGDQQQSTEQESSGSDFEDDVPF